MRRKNKKLPISALSNSKELIVESLKLPKDTMLGAAIVTITGNREAFIENYKGILEYQEFYIRISTYLGIININGFNLNLTEMTTDDIMITGKIETVDFEEIE